MKLSWENFWNNISCTDHSRFECLSWTHATTPIHTTSLTEPLYCVPYNFNLRFIPLGAHALIEYPHRGKPDIERLSEFVYGVSIIVDLCRQRSVFDIRIWSVDLSPRLNDIVGMIILLVTGLVGSFIAFVSEILIGGKLFQPAKDKKRELLCTTSSSCYKLLCTTSCTTSWKDKNPCSVQSQNSLM